MKAEIILHSGNIRKVRSKVASCSLQTSFDRAACLTLGSRFTAAFGAHSGMASTALTLASGTLAPLFDIHVLVLPSNDMLASVTDGLCVHDLVFFFVVAKVQSRWSMEMLR